VSKDALARANVSLVHVMFLVSVLEQQDRYWIKWLHCLRLARVLDLSGQATKGAWGMSWHQKAMKGVEVCEKPGGADKQALIPGFPN
jgi:hypothetical protein